MKKLDFILTCDDAGRGDVKEFNKFLSLLDEKKIKATFFAVPKPRDNIPLSENKEWIYALKKAISNGHDVQLHGYSHERFECGFPIKFIMSLYPKAERENLIKSLYENRGEIEKNLSLKKLDEKISESKEMFEEALGYSPVCFRSPLLGMHANLYSALKNAGIEYSSNFVLNTYGWEYINKERKKGGWIKDLYPVFTKTREGITEFPISCEYSLSLNKGNLRRAFSEIKRDARKIAEIKDSFMMPLTHFWAIAKSPFGEVLYRKFFDWAKKNFDFKSYTISDYIKEKSNIKF
jgi:peptidoglycan/xylan/chitin deacetylase (PgdA/CDA1 family)